MLTIPPHQNPASNFYSDLSHLENLSQIIRHHKPSIIVNAAAYTQVDQAESEKELSSLVNSKAPEILAREAKTLNAWLIHYSSDYVHDGSGDHFWQETDPTQPVNHYGKTKLEGEQAIQASGCKQLIFRTSWVYSARGRNFAKTILGLASEREVIRVINDQIGIPTPADLIADITAHAIRMAIQQSQDLSGLYNLVPQGEISWYDYAGFLINEARNLEASLKVQEIIPISSSEYLVPARRPLNSRLNTNKLQNTFSIHLPEWKLGVRRMISEYLRK